LLVCVNSSTNFVIYSIFGKKFRAKLKEAFTCRANTNRHAMQRNNTLLSANPTALSGVHAASAPNPVTCGLIAVPARGGESADWIDPTRLKSVNWCTHDAHRRLSPPCLKTTIASDRDEGKSIESESTQSQSHQPSTIDRANCVHFAGDATSVLHTSAHAPFNPFTVAATHNNNHINTVNMNNKSNSMNTNNTTNNNNNNNNTVQYGDELKINCNLCAQNGKDQAQKETFV
jgi:hypothetical protein